MFDNLSYFTENDKRAYINALVAISLSDGVIHDEEKEYLDMQAAILGIDKSVYEPYKSDLSILNDSLSKTVRLAIVRDCIVLANADRDYVEEERKKVFEVARLLNISESQVEEIETWVNDLFEVIDRGKRIFQT